MTIRSFAGVLLAGAAVGQTLPLVANWEAADAQTVRLAPEEIGTLPVSVRQELARLGCTIPQVPGTDRPANVVTGRFTSSSRWDIAVLCSRNKVSSILVFVVGSTTPVAELAAAPDQQFLQDMGGGLIGFARALQVADPQSIRREHAAHGRAEPPLQDHDGIEDVFVEKGSTIWYWHEGRWLQLMGSD